MHHADLAGRPTKTQKPQFQPKHQRFPELYGLVSRLPINVSVSGAGLHVYLPVKQCLTVVYLARPGNRAALIQRGQQATLFTWLPDSANSAKAKSGLGGINCEKKRNFTNEGPFDTRPYKGMVGRSGIPLTSVRFIRNIDDYFSYLIFVYRF
jgi:hypothetical protein